MANEEVLKEYSGAAPATTLATTITNVSTSIVLTSGVGYPTGATAPFVIAIGRGTATEEKVLCSVRVGNTLTAIERGYDGTSAQSQAAGKAIEHVLDAYSIGQANRFVNTMTAVGDLIVKAAGSAFARIAIGSKGSVLQSDGTTAAWAQVIPAGSAMFYAGAAQPTGWLFHNQAVANADTTYPALWAAAPASWKSGSTLTIPDFTDRVLAQAGTTALGATGGANSRTIASANLPVHTHTIDHDHGSVTSSGGGSHNHSGAVFVAQNSGAVTLGGGFQVGVANIPTEPDHTHSVDLPNFTGASGNGGFANTALTTTPAHAAFNVIIKAH
jgi:microcystin-dependent protein